MRCLNHPKVIAAFVPAVFAKVESPVTCNAPLWVIAPPLVRVKAPVAVIPAIEVAVVSAKVTAAPVKVTAPVTRVRSAPAQINRLTWALTVRVPSTSMSPKSVTAPVAVIERLFTFRPDWIAKALLSVIVTSLPASVVKVTFPV